MTEDRTSCRFAWQHLGDIEHGRPNLREKAPVLAYRLLQCTLRDVLAAELGADRANAIFVKAGNLAGTHFCENLLRRKIEELEQALGHIKSLEGILPICSYCKRIRKENAEPQDQMSWVKLPNCITSRTDAKFSLSICPECLLAHFS